MPQLSEKAIQKSKFSIYIKKNVPFLWELYFFTLIKTTIAIHEIVLLYVTDDI